MPVIKTFEKVSVWDRICKDFEEKKKLTDRSKEIVEFDPKKHNPVFYGYGYLFSMLDDEKLLTDIDSSVSHPSCYGYGLNPVSLKESPKIVTTVKPDKNKCSEREYIENFVFPTLLPCLEKMLETAKLNKCFEKKRTAFNACDFITEYLYKNNPNKADEEAERRKEMTLWDVPFVKDWLILHPRPPIPKSLIWTEAEATLKIQSFYRGYLVRRDPEVQELRKWQKELREENLNISQRVEEFWHEELEPAAFKKSTSSIDKLHIDKP